MKTATVIEQCMEIGTFSVETAPNEFLRNLVAEAIEYGEATALDPEGCEVGAVANEEEEKKMSATQIASKQNLIVAYHDGGQMFAGDEEVYEEGWYLFNGEEAVPVTVITPFSNRVWEPESA